MTDTTSIRRPRKMAREAYTSVPDAGQEAMDIDPAATPPGQPKSISKIGRVLELMHSPAGASIADLVDATGWQPHTTRAALTGLRKKDHAIGKRNVDGVTRYNIAGLSGE